MFAKNEAVDAQGRMRLPCQRWNVHHTFRTKCWCNFGVSEEAKESLRGRVQTQVDEVVVSQDHRFDFKGDLELWNLPLG